ncbi:glutamine amidotransferase [Labrys miyagiensis]|uniref:Glutamine amidotransferase n=1 Tax=Labrys miyagiensis TaxID=346912 RepID=A0ABQ6CTI6_9HYPH|nr:glutamine amidotransferase [Labrys miyagiensis]GLS22300.1 glutamine amidotransferase [Labrys miyagiensis]
MTRKKILIVLHQEHSSPGRIGRLLIERGHELDIRRPRFDDPLPRTMGEHDGAVIFGGPMSANDDEAWIRREIDWIGVPLREDKPFLGVCLGAQMLARHLGGKVAPREDGAVEIGYWPIKATQDGHAMMEWPGHVYHWHKEGFEHVRGTRLLATGETFTNQAFACERAAYGIQFHPEVTYLMMNRWTAKSEEKLRATGAQDRETQLWGRHQHDHSVQQWLHSFLDLWLKPRMAVAAE